VRVRRTTDPSRASTSGATPWDASDFTIAHAPPCSAAWALRQAALHQQTLEQPSHSFVSPAAT
jgi:hypothetical protein